MLSWPATVHRHVFNTQIYARSSDSVRFSFPPWIWPFTNSRFQLVINMRCMLYTAKIGVTFYADSFVQWQYCVKIWSCRWNCSYPTITRQNLITYIRYRLVNGFPTKPKGKSSNLTARCRGVHMKFIFTRALQSNLRIDRRSFMPSTFNRHAVIWFVLSMCPRHSNDGQISRKPNLLTTGNCMVSER